MAALPMQCCSTESSLTTHDLHCTYSNCFINPNTNRHFALVKDSMEQEHEEHDVPELVAALGPPSLEDVATAAGSTPHQRE